MSCDEAFERCIQKKFDHAFPAAPEERTVEEILEGPHRLIGAEIRMKVNYSEETFLEGVTRIEFHEGRVAFHTVLGEEIHVTAGIEKVIIEKRSLALQFSRNFDSHQ